MLKFLWLRLKIALFVKGDVQLGARFHVGMLTYVSAPRSLQIGDDVYIGKFCSVQVNGSIGNGVLIANNVGIVGRKDHDFRQVGVLVRNASWVGDSQILASDPKNSVDIGDDVWIGYGAVILSGVKIGRGAVVAAGAVVVNDVNPYSIVSGNPAKSVGVRFDANEIVRHEESIGRDQ